MTTTYRLEEAAALGSRASRADQGGTAMTHPTPEAALAAALREHWYADRPLVEPGGGNLDDVLAEDARIILDALSSYSLVPTGEVERLRGIEAFIRDLDRVPTLQEIADYGLDGSPGTNFNTLQWKLDRIRATLTEDETGGSL